MGFSRSLKVYSFVPKAATVFFGFLFTILCLALLRCFSVNIKFLLVFLKYFKTILKKGSKKKRPTESAAFIFPEPIQRSSEECSVTCTECARTHKGS